MTLEDLKRRASNEEVSIIWPLFFEERERVRQIHQIQAEHQAEATRGRL